jgi:hypothetical protein
MMRRSRTEMAQTTLWLMLLLLLLPGRVWGSAAADEVTYRNTVERYSGGFRVEVATDKHLYEPGDSLRVRYTFEAAGDSLIVFQFGSAPYWDVGMYESRSDSLLEYSTMFTDMTVHVVTVRWGEPIVQYATFGLEKHDWSPPADIRVSGTLGRIGFLPTSELSYSLSRNADPTYERRPFWFLEADPPRVVSVGEPDFDPELDADNSGVLDFTDLLLLADSDALYAWQSLASDSTMAQVLALVREANADFDSSGRVDWSDMFLFADHYGSTVGDERYGPQFDLEGDGSIGISDFFLFADRFGGER